MRCPDDHLARPGLCMHLARSQAETQIASLFDFFVNLIGCNASPCSARDSQFGTMPPLSDEARHFRDQDRLAVSADQRELTILLRHRPTLHAELPAVEDALVWQLPIMHNRRRGIGCEL